MNTHVEEGESRFSFHKMIYTDYVSQCLLHSYLFHSHDIMMVIGLG